jgi:hypothetical protein
VFDIQLKYMLSGSLGYIDEGLIKGLELKL